jgi:hypothetical protein
MSGPLSEREADAALERLRVLLDEAERVVSRETMRLMVKERGALDTSARARQTAEEVVRQLRTAIGELERSANREAVQAAVRSARAEASAVGVTFDARLAGAIDRVVVDRLDEITKTFADAADEVARAVRVATTTGSDLADVVDKVQAAIGTTRPRALAAVDSAAMAAGRVVTLADGARTGMVYRYGGPVDRLMRPFCRATHTDNTGNVYTAAALDAMNNGVGQPQPVSAYMGGFQCRHRLEPITRQEATRRGWTIVE